MAYLEELLPEFRKGAKIRCKNWGKDEYIQKKSGLVATENDFLCSLPASDIFSNRWELYKDPEPDWQYIIDHKCLCLFWDYNESKKHIGILKSINKYETYKFSIVTPDNYVSDISFVNCRPVRRDEVTFYEDKKDV
jgi:hypothetical protein